jgi:hypothetical protein
MRLSMASSAARAGAAKNKTSAMTQMPAATLRKFL